MKRATIAPILHRPCGSPVTWRLSTFGDGSPFCGACHRRVEDAHELTTRGPLCVTSDGWLMTSPILRRAGASGPTRASQAAPARGGR